jgi:signal transduction histidine kinase
MLTDSTTGKIDINGNKADIPGALKAKAGTETHEAASSNSDSQESPLKAPQNNWGAKEAALGAIHRFSQESKLAEQKAKKMVSDLEAVVQLALNAAKKSYAIDEKEAAQGDSPTATSKELPPGNDSSASVADAEKSLSDNNKPANDKVKAEFYHLLMTKNPRLRHFIDDLTEDKAKIKIDKIVTEAKSEIIAARIVVNRAQEEINASKEETKKALLESEATHKAAELIVSQVKKDAITQSADEIARARAEVKAIQEAANEAVRRAEEEVKKSHEEVAALSDYAKETLALAQDKVKKSAEELRVYKLQAQSALKQAQEEIKKARAETEAMRREAKSALGKATLESQQAKADMELARRTMQEATVMAEKQAYEKICEEMKQMRDELEITNKKTQEAIAKAHGETQQARQELEAVKKNSEEALNMARKGTLEAKKEAEKAKQAIQEVINQAKEENRRVREEAEKSIIKANEVIVQAKKDVINMTKGEIVRARQELESPASVVESAEKKLEKLADQKLNSEYVANVLHEMRNPLHSIAGFARLMLEEDVADDKTRKEFLSIMVQQSESLNKLIDDISKTLNDKGEAFGINKETVSPYNIVSEAIDSVQGMAQQKKNLISHDLTPSLPEIEVDAFRIKQVIVNLLANAIKFSPENSPIYVKAGVHDHELLIQIIDHGIGISQADIPSLFDRYYQAKNNGDAEGTGLGLFICRQIIEAHNGRIWAESKEGEGSTFSFALPIAAARQ